MLLCSEVEKPQVTDRNQTTKLPTSATPGSTTRPRSPGPVSGIHHASLEKSPKKGRPPLHEQLIRDTTFSTPPRPF